MQRKQVETDRQGRRPSDDDLDDLSDEFHGYSGNHTRDGYLIPKFNYIGYARALLSRYSSGQPAAVRCNHCGWRGADVDLVRDVAADEPDDGAADVCPQCKRIGDLQDIGQPAASVRPVDVRSAHAIADLVSAADPATGPIEALHAAIDRLAAPVAAQAQQPVSGADELRAEVSRLQKMFEAADKGMHNECVRGDRLESALRGMLQLDEENHQRHPGDEDVCKEVRDARAALSAHGRHANLAAQAQPTGYEEAGSFIWDGDEWRMAAAKYGEDPDVVTLYKRVNAQDEPQQSGNSGELPTAQDREDAERYRWATALDDNSETLHSIVLSYGGDQAKINERVDVYRACDARAAKGADHG